MSEGSAAPRSAPGPPPTGKHGEQHGAALAPRYPLTPRPCARWPCPPRPPRPPPRYFRVHRGLIRFPSDAPMARPDPETLAPPRRQSLLVRSTACLALCPPTESASAGQAGRTADAGGGRLAPRAHGASDPQVGGLRVRHGLRVSCAGSFMATQHNNGAPVLSARAVGAVHRATCNVQRATRHLAEQ